MSKDNGGWAFPSNDIGGDYEQGMNMRDYFAAKAMQGIISNDGLWSRGGVESQLQKKTLACIAAEYAYSIADEMLKARDK
jgi:hypothetical protein